MNIEKLKKTANRIRIDTIRSLYSAQSGHPGSSLGIADTLTALYFGAVLRHKPRRPDWVGRDYFLLSNGHAAPGLYAALAVAGYYPVKKLDGLRKIGTPMHGHPKRGTFPGVELSSGSLGMGLSVGIGLALGLKLRGRKNRVYVMESDGGMEEGSSWEAVMYAPKHNLDNLVLIIDDNESQINGPTREVMPNLDPLGEKFVAFGWEAEEIDGHDFKQILSAFAKAESAKGPFAIISNTIIGKGVSYMEGDYRWHHGVLTKEQYEKALDDLGGQE